MTPPPFLYAEVSEIDSGNDPLRVWVDGQPGAVPYMLARPQSIETAPRDGTRFLGARNGGWEIYWWSEHHRLWFPRAPMKWLPLPPAPEEA